MSDRIVLCVGDCFHCGAGAEDRLEALRAEGLRVMMASSQEAAAMLLCYVAPAVVVIDLGLMRGSPLAVADFCHYRRPEARVILAGCGGLMADGAIFRHVTNAAALVPGPISARDLSALVAYHADRGRPRARGGAPAARTAADLGGRRIPIGRVLEDAGAR